MSEPYQCISQWSFDLLSDQLKGFSPSELPGPVTCYHKYQIVNSCSVDSFISFKLICHLFLLFYDKVCFKAGGGL